MNVSIKFDVSSKFSIEKVQEKFPQVISIEFKKNGLMYRCKVSIIQSNNSSIRSNFDLLEEISKFCKSFQEENMNQGEIPREAMDLFINGAKKFDNISQLMNYAGKGGKLKVSNNFSYCWITRKQGEPEKLFFSKNLIEHLQRNGLDFNELIKFYVTDIISKDQNGVEKRLRRLVYFNDESYELSDFI